MTIVDVSTPSRLHFGLLRLHESPGRSFGGLGLMVVQPRVKLHMSASREWHVSGPQAERALAFGQQALAATPWQSPPAGLELAVTSVPPAHRGLGSGTQLALAIAAGVRALAGLPPGRASDLANAVGRGARSGVGSHGFVHGGLIWERGRSTGAQLSDLTAQVALPSAWHVLLISPSAAQPPTTSEGLSGDGERDAFARLPAVPESIWRQLEHWAEAEILPAAHAANFAAFSDAVFRYGRQSGECFAPVQGDAYASPAIRARVEELRALGVRGVGQSSWGPTVFAFAESEASAAAIATSLRGLPAFATTDIQITRPDNRGAVVTTGQQAPRAE